MTNEKVKALAFKAENLMDYLQFVFAFLLGVAFIAAVIGLVPQFLSTFSGEFGSEELVGFLSNVLMVGLIGTTVSVAITKFKDVDRMKRFITMALIGVGVGILEDWLGPAQVSGKPHLLLSVVFSLMLFSLLVALPIVSGEKKEI